MAFASFGTEVNTHDFIKTSLASGKRIILPISIKEDRSLFLQEIKSFDELKKGTYGILEPEMKENFDRSKLDLVIVPGVAFDHRGYRMGYGGGYYDRFLSSLDKRTKIIAINFEELYVYRVIISRFDMKVPVLITDRKIRNFQRRTL
ncbi:5-formyltetrahydrofolate cyclo-ligase [Fenollaria sporofastidiosus]|nr:5-formyltetrahydrofolate cyclo-ligase [Fenollaria sporofastidiosus]